MLTFLAPLVGEKLAKPAFFALMAIVLGGGAYALGRCKDDNADVVAQVEQTNRSGEAISNAAEMAIDKLENRTVTDQEIDRAVASTVQEIDRAETADDVRAAVLRGLCGQPEHRADPACRVR